MVGNQTWDFYANRKLGNKPLQNFMRNYILPNLETFSFSRVLVYMNTEIEIACRNFEKVKVSLMLKLINFE